MIQVVDTVQALRDRVGGWRGQGGHVALVPTMGHLHAGHLELMRAAREQADRVVASVFVNPLQFGAGGDFGTYPRTLEADRAAVDRAGADLLFAPALAEVYPRGQVVQTRVEVPGLSDILCGASRPGHFVGVTTVVCKLLNMVQPDVAVFGEKDFQQLLVIRRMVGDLAMPVAIHGVPTVREPDGLAMSSRNAYLTAAERERAPALYRTLFRAAQAIAAGGSDYPKLEAGAVDNLREAGLRADYFTVRRAVDLEPPGPDDRDLVLLAAAWLGKARLIDNLRVSGQKNI